VTARVESEMPRALSDAAAALLHWSGALGVELEDDEQLAPPGSAPIAAGRARLRGHFQELGEAQEALTLLREKLGVEGVVSELAETDWVATFKAHFKPRQVGSLFLTAPWHEEATPAGLTRLTIEPGLAFGTGDHPTTELCLRALEAFLASHPGASVLDVGTGSGILAIAAKKLGARRVAATDNDPRAERETVENSARNGVELEIVSLQTVGGTFDLVLANILANTLAELAPELARSVASAGQLCLSGILQAQTDELVLTYAPWFRQVERVVEGDWVLLKLSKEVEHGQG
jgi:ribosomal protein L11 methyltransferase